MKNQGLNDRRTAGTRNITVPKEKAPDFTIMLIHILKKHCQIHGGELTRYQEREKRGFFHIEHKDVSIIARMREILHEEFGIPVEEIGYYGSTQNNIYMKLSVLNEEVKLKVADVFSHINSIVVKKFENVVKKTEQMAEKDSIKSTEPVKKEYTGKPRGRKSNAERTRTASLAKNEASAEPSNNVPKEPKVTKALKIPKVKKEKLPKVPKVKKQPDVSDKEKLVNAYKFKVRSFLTTVINFENSIKPFSPAKAADDRLFYFGEISKGSYHYLLCRDEEVRDVVFKALIYAMPLGDYPHTPFVSTVADEIHYRCIKVDFEGMDVWRKEKPGINYCLPPKIGASTQEVRMRIMKVSNVPPDIDQLGDSLLISYWNKEIAKETFSLLSEMGWNVSKLRERDFALDLRPISSEKKKVEPNEKAIPASFELAAVPAVKEPLTLSEKLFLLVSNNEEEALSDLDKIFFDVETFNQLSTEMAEKIAAILKESYRKRQPEEYAEHLLKILGK